MDGGAWWTIVHGVAKIRTQMSNSAFTFTLIAQLLSKHYMALPLPPHPLCELKYLEK